MIFSDAEAYEGLESLGAIDGPQGRGAAGLALIGLFESAVDRSGYGLEPPDVPAILWRPEWSELVESVLEAGYECGVDLRNEQAARRR